MNTLTLACGAYDRVRPLFDGRVQVPGVRLLCLAMPSEQSFPRAVARAEFDVSELSLSAQLIQVSRGEAAYVALPIPVARAFRHGCIYIRTDAGIACAKDLERRVVGLPEYGMTAGLWLRGILAEDHGVMLDSIRWRTAGTNVPGRRERLSLELPPSFDVRALADGATLNDALLAGDIDAALSPTPPRAFTDGDSRVTRLFINPRQAAEDYHRRTGFFPTMHLIGVRREILERDRWLGRALYEAFANAKLLAESEWEATLAASSPATMFPFLAEEWTAMKALLGADPWCYGVRANRAELETVCRWSFAQHLSRHLVTLHEFFDVATLDT